MTVDNTFAVLVVEDDRDMAFTISKLLVKEFEVHVDTALDIASARKRLAAEHYDVVTLDYQLPDGDGLDLLADIARDSTETRTIVITGHGDKEIADRALKSGALAYIIKDTRLVPSLSKAFRQAMDELA